MHNTYWMLAKRFVKIDPEAVNGSMMNCVTTLDLASIVMTR
jgi:hypothetical protein